MTTTRTLSQNTPPAARVAAWGFVNFLIAQGKPLPAGMRVDKDGHLTLQFDDLAEGEQWAAAFALELQGSRRRPSVADPAGVITVYAGKHQNVAVSLYIHEPLSVVGAGAYERVEAYICRRRAPDDLNAWATRDDSAGEIGAPLPAGVDGFAAGGRHRAGGAS